MLDLSLALTLRIFSNPVANACQKKLGERVSSLCVNFYVSLLMSLGCIIPAFFVNWQNFSLEFWSYVFMAGLFCSLGTICLIKALHYGELSILGPLNSYKSVVGLVSAFLLLGELPKLVAILGVVLIVFGSLFLISPNRTNDYDAKKMWISVGLRFVALIFTGCEASILKKIILMSSPEISFILWCFSGFVLGGLFLIFVPKKVSIPAKSDLMKYIITAISLSVMQFSTNIVFSKMAVASALALFQLSSLVNLFLGYKIFKEGNLVRKFIGTVVMIFGASLILFNK